MPPVLIRLLSDDPSPVRIEGVVVEFYNTGAIFQTSGTTDINGEVTVTLPDASYDLLFFKVGISIQPRQPQRIVVDHLLINHFEVTAHVRALPESIDPKKCTISGFILGVGGGPAIHRLIFEPLKLLTVKAGNVIAPYHRIEFTSDETGYFQFELLRDTKYNGYFVFPQDLFSVQPGRLDVITPNAASVDLHDFLFPLPLNLVFSISTISMVAGAPQDDTTTVTLNFTDGSTRTVLATPWAGVTLSNTDNKVVDAGLKDGLLTLRPLKAGTATISTVREIPDSVFIDPLPAYTTGSIVVTVT